MCGTPTTSGLLIAVWTGTWQPAGPIFLRAPLAQALSSLRWPHSWFPYLVVTAHPALTVSVTLGVLITLASFVALTMLATFAMQPALAVRPVQFSLPGFVTPGPRTELVTVFTLSMLGIFPDGGIVNISLWRDPGLFALFSIKWGGLSFGHCLVQMLRVLVVLVVVYGPVQLGQAPKLHLNDGVEAVE